MDGFYSFNLDYEPQLRTNWCWAACFSWMLKKFNPNAGIFEQWEILKYYTLLNATTVLKLSQNNIEDDSKFNITIGTIDEEVDLLIQTLLKLKSEKVEINTSGNNRYNLLWELFSYERISNELHSKKHL